MVVLIIVFLVFWKFLSVDAVLKPKKFCLHGPGRSTPMFRAKCYTTQLSITRKGIKEEGQS